MKNKYFPDEKIDADDVYFVCYMIERVARQIKQRNRYVVNTIGAEGLYHLLSCAKAQHCENPEKIAHDWTQDYNLQAGDFNITDVDPELARIIPSELDMGAVYMRIVLNTMLADENYADAIIRTYNNPVCEVVDNYNASAFYEPSYVQARAFQEGGF